MATPNNPRKANIWALDAWRGVLCVNDREENADKDDELGHKGELFHDHHFEDGRLYGRSDDSLRTTTG